LTVAVNGSSPINVAIPGTSGWTTTLTAGIIPANKPLLICYDGTNLNVQQTGTVSSGGSFGGSPINPQTAPYQVLASDFSNYKTITITSGSGAVTLVASTSQPAANTFIHVINIGASAITIARSGQNINTGTTSIPLAAGATYPQDSWVYSDGSNYWATLGSSNASQLNGGTFASPGTGIGSGTANTVYGTVLRSTTSYSPTSTGHIENSATAPTIGTCGTSPSVVVSNGTAVFEINVGTGGTASTCAFTMPAATTGWACQANDVTNPTTGGGYNVKQTSAISTTAVTLTGYNTSASATAWTASDILLVSCKGF
jgi:hypothetical protein